MPPITTTVTLRRDQPFVEVAVTLHDKPLDPWPEGAWICLPLKVDSPTFTLGRLGGPVDPAADVVPGSNFYFYYLNTGLTVRDPQGRGVGVCPIDSPCVSLQKPGLWQYTRDKFIPEKSWVYVNLFNNEWSTNFRMWNGRTWTSRVRIWATAGADLEHNLITPSW